MKLPPGLGVPGAVQEKFKRLDALAPYKRVAANQYGPSVRTINRGSLVQFHYLFWIHDPQPLVIVTDIFPNYIRGVNLHYLTFPYILKLLQPYCDQGGFSYYNIKADQYIVNAFRTYKRMGVKRPKALDCAFILNVLGSVRTIDPNEIETIRQLVQEQIKTRAQPKAEELAQRYQQMMQGQQEQGFVNQNAPPPVERNLLPPEGPNLGPQQDWLGQWQPPQV
jgi:hypothetical protein